MDITKLPAPAVATGSPQPAPRADQGLRSPPSAAPVADRADIRPLDIPAALQILLAEVRAEFELQALAVGDDATEAVSGPPQAARALLQLFLSATPDEAASLPEWSEVLVRVETALQSGLNRGIDAVSAWRDVPAVVVDAAKEARAQAFSVLDADPQNPLWLRPEWAGLGPRFERFWRRRRRVRRQLTDPDPSARSVDDDSEPRA
jgi:hypothetical protein